MENSSFLRLPFKFPLRRFSSVPCLQSSSSDSDYLTTPSLPSHLAHATQSNPVDEENLEIRINAEDDETSILNIFDPLRPSTELVDNLPEISLDQICLPPLFPHPIKIRLKLSTCSEMKPFYQLVQQIHDEYRTNEVFLLRHFLSFIDHSSRHPVMKLFTVNVFVD